MVDMSHAGEREQIPDKVLMYACIFSHEKFAVRTEILNYTPNFQVIDNLITQGQLPANATSSIQAFLKLDNDSQRAFLDDEAKLEDNKQLMRNLLQIVSKISSEPNLVRWALALINGIIEDNRGRIRFLSLLQKSRSSAPEKKLDCIRVLNSFITQSSDLQERPVRDMAAHTLAILIADSGIAKAEQAEEANSFLNTILANKDRPEQFSRHTFTHSLMYLLKIN